MKYEGMDKMKFTQEEVVKIMRKYILDTEGLMTWDKSVSFEKDSGDLQIQYVSETPFVLTEQIQDKIKVAREESLKGVLDGGQYNDFDINKAGELIDWVYWYCGYKMPKVFVAENPLEQQLLYRYLIQVASSDKDNELKAMLGNTKAPININIMHEMNSTFSVYNDIVAKDLYLTGSNDVDAYWRQGEMRMLLNMYSPVEKFVLDGIGADVYSESNAPNMNIMSRLEMYRLKFLKEEFNLPFQKEYEFNMSFELQKNSGIYSAICTDGICVISKYPKKINKDETGRLHSVTGSAVEWGADNSETRLGIYFIHGRKMPSWIFETDFTKEQFINEKDEDIKAGMYEVIEARGEGSMLTFLGAEMVHEQSFVHPNEDIEYMELYKTKETFWEERDLNGKSDVPLCWLKMTCPSTGTNYIIASDSSFNTCEEAAKYARPEYITKELPYEWASRS